MTTRRVWLQPEVRETEIAALAAEAGYVRSFDRPPSRFESRRVIFEQGDTQLTLEAYHEYGCQTLSLSGEDDALWTELAGLPRYDSHVEDAAAGDPAQMLRGLRRWVLSAAYEEEADGELVKALSKAAEHDSAVVRLSVIELSYLAMGNSREALHELARRRLEIDSELRDNWGHLAQVLSARTS